MLLQDIAKLYHQLSKELPGRILIHAFMLEVIKQLPQSTYEANSLPDRPAVTEAVEGEGAAYGEMVKADREEFFRQTAEQMRKRAESAEFSSKQYESRTKELESGIEELYGKCGLLRVEKEALESKLKTARDLATQADLLVEMVTDLYGDGVSSEGGDRSQFITKWQYNHPRHFKVGYRPDMTIAKVAAEYQAKAREILADNPADLPPRTCPSPTGCDSCPNPDYCKSLREKAGLQTPPVAPVEKTTCGTCLDKKVVWRESCFSAGGRVGHDIPCPDCQPAKQEDAGKTYRVKRAKRGSESGLLYVEFSDGRVFVQDTEGWVIDVRRFDGCNLVGIELHGPELVAVQEQFERENPLP